MNLVLPMHSSSVLSFLERLCVVFRVPWIDHGFLYSAEPGLFWASCGPVAS